jgi:hypothetical protein
MNTDDEMPADQTGTLGAMQVPAGTGAMRLVFSEAEHGVPCAMLVTVCDPVSSRVIDVVPEPQMASIGKVQPVTLALVLLTTSFFTMRSPTGRQSSVFVTVMVWDVPVTVMVAGATTADQTGLRPAGQTPVGTVSGAVFSVAEQIVPNGILLIV